MHLLQHEQRAIEQPEHLRVDLGRVARRGREELVQHGHAHTLGEELLREREDTPVRPPPSLSGLTAQRNVLF